jgi:hypothetical protein
VRIFDRINECARNLNDGKLLAVLCGGDVVAQELKYHYSYFKALYNKERAHAAAENKKDGVLPDPDYYQWCFQNFSLISRR